MRSRSRTVKNEVTEEIKSRLVSGKACFYSIKKLLILRLISRKLKLKIYIRSLLTHKTLLQALLLEEKAHAFLLNETHLNVRRSCKIPGYHLLRKESNMPMLRANGGVAIGYRPSILHGLHTISNLQQPEYLISTIY